MSRKQYSKELKLELVKKHLPTKEHKGLNVEISFSFYSCKNMLFLFMQYVMGAGCPVDIRLAQTVAVTNSSQNN